MGQRYTQAMSVAPSAREQIDALWNYADPALSERRFREFLRTAPLADADRAEALTQLSRACCLQRHHDAAREALDAAQRLLPPGANRARVRFLLESGRLANETGRDRNGVPMFEEAFRLAGGCGEDFFAVDAAHMLGYVLRGREGVAWHERGLRAAREAREERARQWLFRLHQNLGVVQEELGEFEAAHRSFENALRETAAGPAGDARRRDVRCSIARAVRLSGDVARALDLQRELAREIEGVETGLHGDVNEEIGECLLALGRGAEAAPHFAIAYDRFKGDPWFPPTAKARLERIRTLAGR